MRQRISIEFDKIPIDKIATKTSGRSAGLQLADAVAGAFFNAMERDKFGNTEPRYVQIISPVLYRYSNKLQGYGVKIVPTGIPSTLMCNAHLEWLHNFT